MLNLLCASRRSINGGVQRDLSDPPQMGHRR
jgi:hypothetical protein